MSFELLTYTYDEEDMTTEQFVHLLLTTATEVTVSVEVNVISLVNGGSATEATQNQDYIFNDGMVVSFMEGESRMAIPLSILADDLVERREGFSLDFSRQAGSPPITNGANPTTTVFIDDSDGNCL